MSNEKKVIDHLDTYINHGVFTIEGLDAMVEKGYELAKFISVDCQSHAVGYYVNMFDQMAYSLSTAFGWIGGDGAPYITLIFEFQGRMRS